MDTIYPPIYTDSATYSQEDKHPAFAPLDNTHFTFRTSTQLQRSKCRQWVIDRKTASKGNLDCCASLSRRPGHLGQEFASLLL